MIEMPAAVSYYRKVMDNRVLEQVAANLGVDSEELQYEGNLMLLHPLRVERLLKVTRGYLERQHREGRIPPYLTPIKGARVYDAYELIEAYGKMCRRESCGRAFLTLDTRKLYCSSTCARRVTALAAIRKRRSRDAATRSRRIAAALRALHRLTKRPRDWKRWAAARAGVSVNSITRYCGSRPEVQPR